MHIEKSFKQLWLVDEKGNRYNVAELLQKLIEKPAPKAKAKKSD